MSTKLVETVFKSKVFDSLMNGLYEKKINNANNNKIIVLFHQPTYKYFLESIKLIRKNFNIVSLDDLIKSYKEDVVKKEAAITFDDGGKSLYYNVFPIVKEEKIPITIYVIAKYLLDQNYEFWFKESLRINNMGLNIDFQKLKYMKYEPRDDYMDKVSRDINYHFTEGDGLELSMLNEILKYNFISIGSHTINHVNLTVEDIKTSENEIIQSKKMIEEILNIKIEDFAYPYGFYDLASENIVREAGYRSATTTDWRFLTKDDSMYTLPRISAGPDNGFTAWLKYHVIISK
jgi:poly-beta-1,6-N-acetyl-D-glucosamine N-deacetylase